MRGKRVAIHAGAAVCLSAFAAQVCFVAPVPVKVNGEEVEGAHRPFDNWNINGVFSWAKGKIENGIVPCNDYFPTDGVPDSTGGVPTIAQIQATTGDNLATCSANFRANTQPVWSTTLQSE